MHERERWEELVDLTQVSLFNAVLRGGLSQGRLQQQQKTRVGVLKEKVQGL